ncbi:MAG: hypothetical protein HGA36_00450 [Candidatus Moranbacteria bacterium]|nr:hypothetical protein [Candidatus Moranbacteria bacterium]
MKKRILVSVDHMYAMGVTAVALIEKLEKRLKSKRYLVFSHSCPDVPRAILQAPMFLAQHPYVGNSFWFDFGTELLTKAKVCEEIMSQWKISLDANEGMVIFCKNMNGTIVHGLLRNPNWHEDGMDGIEDRMRCGISLGEQVSPDLNILLDATSESVLPVYQKSINDCLEQFDDPVKKENMRVFFEEIDFLSHRQLYLDEFARMGNKALTLNTEIGMDEMVEEAAKRIEELLS